MLTRIQQYLHAVTPIGRENEQVGPFLATFNPHSDNPYLNYALPDDDAEPSDDEVAALVKACRGGAVGLDSSTSPAVRRQSSNGYSPRGFVIEGRLPVMVTDARHLGAGSEPQGFDLRLPITDDELYDMAVVQAEAYDEPEVPGRDVVTLRRNGAGPGAVASSLC